MNEISLIHFPEKFYPLVVVTGDRREERPKTKGDLLAYSMSVIDITYLLHLQLSNVAMVTDKTFVLEDDQTLKEEFGDMNLLVVGSPAVNLLARQMNDRHPFRFDISNVAKRDVVEHEKLLDKIKFNPTALHAYKQIFEHGLSPKEIADTYFRDSPDRPKLEQETEKVYEDFQSLRLNFRQWKFFIHNFDRPGIIDPMDGEKHAVMTNAYNDFGLVSVARNPYSNGNRYMISVAGIHGIATARGLSLLETPEKSFKERPCGGVFEVQFPEYGSWSEKLHKGQMKWQTRSYFKKYPFILDTLRAIANRKRRPVKKFGFFVSSPFSEKDKKYRALNDKLEKICKRYFAESATAYSVKTSGKGSFTTVIQKTISNSSALIHLLNGYRFGVLFEIGLSIGLKKHAFLVWDQKFGVFRSSELPELLSKLNVIRFNSSDEEDFSRIIVEDIIEPAQGIWEDQHGLKAAMGYIVKRLPKRSSLNKTFVYCSQSLSEYGKFIYDVCGDEFRIPALQEQDLRGENQLERYCYGIGSAKRGVFLLDEKDREGPILLGIARALEMNCVLLRETNLSMWHGDHKPTRPSTMVPDIQRGLRVFFRRD